MLKFVKVIITPRLVYSVYSQFQCPPIKISHILNYRFMHIQCIHIVLIRKPQTGHNHNHKHWQGKPIPELSNRISMKTAQQSLSRERKTLERTPGQLPIIFCNQRCLSERFLSNQKDIDWQRMSISPNENSSGIPCARYCFHYTGRLRKNAKSFLSKTLRFRLDASGTLR
jgi:hypothetical protein